ncbi:MAG TPA: hypothetical protein VKR78_05655, partial [Acidimicrobiales bacterium]|nr:hypothetical protein [Acidimicrobiales bacterium]
MPRRIEIELTSRTGDGVFTWRAAGAKQPKGTVSTELLPAGVAVGDVVRAEIETGLEGLEIVSVAARQGKADDRSANRIEVVGTPRRGPDVVVSYASGRPRRDDVERGGPRRGREAGARGPRARRAPGDAPRDVRPSRGRRERSEEHAEDETTRPARPGAQERRPRPERGAPREGAPREGAPREGAARAEASDRAGRPPRPDRRDATAARRAPRPTVSTAYRNSLLATLGPQELPIAEQLLRGGIPAVRQALADQYGARPTDAAAEANRDAVLSLAEQLLPRVNLAGWKDRAASAQAAGKEFRLRELRAVVTAARTVTLDDEARTIARSLQESLEQRVRALREQWVGRMEKSLADGRVEDAVRVSARPPEPATRLPAELAVRLAEAAGQAMTAETPAPQLMSLLGAVVESAVRRNVKPRGIPEDEQAK